MTLLALTWVACPNTQKYKGDVVLGTFAFVADRDSGDCPFDVGPDGGSASPDVLNFTGLFSLDSRSNTLFLNINGFDRQGPLELERFFSLGVEAERVAGDGGGVDLYETIVGRFYSEGQLPLSDGGCPALEGPAYYSDGGLERFDGGYSPCNIPTGVQGNLFDAFDGGIYEDGGQGTCTIVYDIVEAVPQ